MKKSLFSPASGHLRHLAAVDAMGIDDDPALGGLPEHLGQSGDRQAARADDDNLHSLMAVGLENANGSCGPDAMGVQEDHDHRSGDGETDRCGLW